MKLILKKTIFEQYIYCLGQMLASTVMYLNLDNLSLSTHSLIGAFSIKKFSDTYECSKLNLGWSSK